MLVFYSCGAKGGSFGGDTSSTPANATSDSADKADSAVGRTEDSILPGVPDVTTTSGNVTDMPNTDKPGGDGMLDSTDGSDTSDMTSAPATAPDTTAPSTTAPAVRPPEGK